MTRPVALLVIGLALLAAPAFAQEPPSVAVGARVRVSTSSTSDPVIGEIVGLNATTLTLSIWKRAAPTIVPRNAITRIEVSRRRSRSGSVLIGALAGLGLGVLLGAAATNEKDLIFNNRAENMAIFGLAAGGAGALLGLGAGPGEDRWVTALLVATGSSGLTPVPRAAAGYTFRF